jgi:hypothetical protein
MAGYAFGFNPPAPTSYESCSFKNLVKRAVGTVSPVERNVRKCSKNKQTEAGCSNPILPSSIAFYRSFSKASAGNPTKEHAAFARLNTEGGFVRGGTKSNSISACWLGGGVSWRVEGLSLLRAR